MLDYVGQQVGNYRILRLLGRGGFAQVYLGEHRYLKSAAALKVLQRSLTQKETERFLEEAQTLVRLRHAHIVRVLDFAVEQGTPVLIMDYVSEGTLRQRHPAGTRLSLDMTVHYITQLASALQYAHNQHVIHRDIKPDNMLLDAEQQLPLSDFGLALLAPSTEQLSTQSVAGTPAYLAPEQVRGKPHFASDQYALGVVTYEWLTGKRPFQGNAWELYHQHLTAPPPPLRERCPELPAAVEQVVHKALAKDPQERYVSITAFAQALERACREGRSEDEDPQRTAPLRLRPPVLPSANEPVARVVFLSAAPGDESAAAQLAADLKQRGVVLTSERAGQGTLQEKDLQAAIRAAQHVVIVVTPQTRSSRLVQEHLRLAQMYQRRLVLVSMQGEEMAGLLLDPLWHPFLPVDVVDARGSRYQAALDELLACLREETHLAPSTPEEPRGPRNPYKGLRAFREEDALDFFGRDTLLEATVALLKNMLAQEQKGAPGSRLLALVGPSGSGKSSVMQAGLLPQLQAGALPGSQNWVYLGPIVPGTHPLESLALKLAPHFPDRSMKALCEDLQDDSARGLHRLCTHLAKGSDCRVVLVVDQFEELFTQTLSEEERRSFVDLLVTAVTEGAGPVLLLLTLRIDFYGHLMPYPHLYQLIEAHHQSILPMEIFDLRAVIEEPAALPDVQLTFEGNLVGDLLFEMQGQVGALPLLQFTLEQLFERRSDHRLTFSAYREIGGIKGALSRYAEQTYAALPSEEHRKLARTLFVRLIEPGATEQDTTRRRATLSEFTLDDPTQTRLLRETIDAFVTARLLTTNKVGNTTTTEVSHEAVIREWKRLAEWMREARQDILLQQALSEDVAEWERRGKSRDRLYRGSQLKEAKGWAGRNTPSRKEAAFLQASAVQRTLTLMGIIVAVLLLVSSMGLAGGIAAWNSLTHPDPTLVTPSQDSVNGSLRYCIDNAPSKSTITFAQNVRGLIKLTGGDLDVVGDKQLTIVGPGKDQLAISGGKINAHFHVSKGATLHISDLSFKNSEVVANAFLYNEGTLTVTNSMISDNRTTDNVNARGIVISLGGGGGIFNRGTLVVTKSTISGNTAGADGGISNFGTLTLNNSIVSDNKATVSGGIGNNGTLTLNNSIVSSNTASGAGGISANGTITLNNSTVSGNAVSGASGGITNYGTIMLNNSMISDNTAQSGGGITNYGTLTLNDSTISDNTASVEFGSIVSTGMLTLNNSTISDNTASRFGGGISIQSSIDASGRASIAQADLTFSTIYGNTAHDGGDIAIEDSDSNGTPIKQLSQVTIRNSIVAGDPAHPGPDILGMLTSGGYNLFQDNSFDSATGALHSTDKAVSVNDLKIDPMLKDNGGSTKPHTLTHALLPGSPAIDAIPLQSCQIKAIFNSQSQMYTDQRGVKRPQGSACDIGAYEYADSST